MIVQYHIPPTHNLFLLHPPRNSFVPFFLSPYLYTFSNSIWIAQTFNFPPFSKRKSFTWPILRQKRTTVFQVKYLLLFCAIYSTRKDIHTNLKSSSKAGVSNTDS